MIAYLDCFQGISGDMTLGALVNLGVPVKWLQNELEKMPLTGFVLHAESVFHAGINAQNIWVETVGRQSCRDYKMVTELIIESPYSQKVKKQCLELFDCLVEAKSRVQGCEKRRVNFNELGTTETIVNIVGAVLGLAFLKIETVLSSTLPLGSGIVKHRHGFIPVPEPAILDILKGRPVFGGGGNREMVTPIGAAIVAILSKHHPGLPPLQVEAVGYGSSRKKSKNTPNLLRIVTGKKIDAASENFEDDLVVCETCIDDMNPEIFGYLMERLFEDGALDVVWLPIFMKKNRPATKIEVLCRKATKEKIIERIFAETTSLGVRCYDVKRHILDRRIIEIGSPWGTIQVKEVTGVDGEKRIVPEYEVCRRIARAYGLSLKKVYEIILHLNYEC